MGCTPRFLLGSEFFRASLPIVFNKIVVIHFIASFSGKIVFFGEVHVGQFLLRFWPQTVTLRHRIVTIGSSGKSDHLIGTQRATREASQSDHQDTPTDAQCCLFVVLCTVL